VTLIGPMLALLRRLIMAACLVLVASHPAAALDQVSMQLKWKHQFQLAGYYAAFEQGFYRAAGFDVTIREGGPGIDVAETVASGKADFGVCSASVLRDGRWAAGWSCWPPSSSALQPFFWSRAGQISAAYRICAAAPSWTRRAAMKSPRR
jgi:ABC-type nitrate/sulfonate/bicarbonate transport system substrate-binding protein